MNKSITNSSLLVVVIVAACLSLMVTMVLGLGLIIGYLMTFFFSSIDLGSATICGLLAIGMTVWCVVQLLKEIDNAKRVLIEETSDDESEVLSEDQVDTITEQLTEAILMRISPSQTRARRNSGRIR